MLEELTVQEKIDLRLQLLELVAGHYSPSLTVKELLDEVKRVEEFVLTTE